MFIPSYHEPRLSVSLSQCICVRPLLVLPLSLGLLLEVMLDTTLLSLALGAHLIVVSLALLVAGEVRNGSADCSLSTTGNA